MTQHTGQCTRAKMAARPIANQTRHGFEWVRCKLWAAAKLVSVSGNLALVYCEIAILVFAISNNV
jgi:hypothetical protein